ncbi:TPA: efflux RND transporter periplasmic adaptor subunit [Klebsiella pneumoniae]|uniref:efflux RND transporter periplasmic adaptor subunit n=1 Tax=Klebsiella pneumoniae TaxID=573 RepID=UPI000C7A6576|nr:efflux RND transporter periplasmic adaptor subunit [Klebsiella pneumoniae]PLM58689.1 efflux RND transporter periplasmic adaptor subunit [Klebsiella pneumoniae]HCB1179110.1 efflux RND transporter periplasmic adaptor subunit [Klebsiella pneumoniae]
MPDEHHVLLKEDVRNLPDTRYLLSLMPLLGCLVLMTIMLAGCDGKKQPTSLPLRPVRFVTVGPRESPGVQTLTGEIRAHDETSLSFRLDGRILTRSADLGSRFRQGDALAVLDSPTAQNQLTSAQADVSSRRAAEKVAALNLHRMRLLMPSGAIARAQLDTAAADWQAALSRLQSSEAALKNAQENVRWTTLTAPVNGLVTGVSASAGQVVSAGQTVFTVASSDARDVVFDVASPGIVSRQPGATFHVALLQDASVIAQAHLRDISPQADPQTRSWRVRITLDNPPPDMVMGASVSVTLPIADSAGEKVITLPASSLTRLSDAPAVFILDPANNKVYRRAVHIAGYSADAVFIRAGVSPGDRVVTAGVRSLRDGEHVAGIQEDQDEAGL